MNRKRILTVFALVLAGLGCAGENLVFNPEFHLGTTGYAITRYHYADRNPDLRYFPLTAVADGNVKQLKIHDPHGDGWWVSSKEFLLEKNTRFRLSGEFRSEGASKNVSLRVMTAFENGWYPLGESSVKTGKEWKKVSKEFSTKDKEDLFFHIEIMGNGAKNSDVFVRNLKLEKIEDSAVEKDRIHAAFVPEKELYTSKNGKTIVNAELKLWNPSGKTRKEVLTLGVAEDYFKTSIFRKEVSVTLAGGEAKILRFEIPVPAFGGYRMTVSGNNLYTHDGFFPVMGVYTPRPVNVLRDFVFSVNNGPAFYHYQDNAYEAWNTPWKEFYRRMAQIGVRMMRDHDGGLEALSWRMLEPEPGKLDYRHFNRFKKALDENHIALMPVLGRHHFIKVGWRSKMVGFPDWVIPRLKHVEKDPPTVMASARGNVWLCSDEDWRHYCTIAAKLLRGKVQVCEIINEPNLYLAPEVYDMYLRSAREIFNRYAPEIKLIGFSVSSDYWTKVDKWLKQSIALGSLDAADIFSFHPYGARQLSSEEPADENIAFFRKILDDAGRGDMPIWNSELYYLSPKLPGKTHDYYTPDALIRRTLVDLGEGCGQSVSIHTNSLWKRLLTPNQLAGECAHEMIPNENAVAANAFARLLEGAVPAKKYRFAMGTVCYLFRRDGQLCAAIWNERNAVDLKFDLSPFKVLDLYGNEVRNPRLGMAPLYLFPKKDNDEFLDRLESFRVAPRIPAAVSSIGRQFGEQLIFGLSNLGETPVNVVYRMEGHSGSADLKASEKTIRSLTLAEKGNGNRSATMHIAFNGESANSRIKVYASEYLVAKEKKSFRLNSPDGKLFADVRVHFTEEGSRFNYRIVVHDDTNAGPRGVRAPWETDCVELFCDPDPLNLTDEHPERYNKQVFRLFWMPRNGPGKKLHGQNVRFNENQHSGVHSITEKTYVVSGSFRVKNKAAGFGIKINDAENSSSKTIREAVFGEGKLFEDRCLFPVIFAEEPAEIVK